jgi:hypothetical protein
MKLLPEWMKLPRRLKNPPARWHWVGCALLESKGCLLRFAYTHAHALQKQQQQGVEFGLCVIVMDNLCIAASRAGVEQFAPLRSN